jgi:Glucose / Sorbosone dehydrogenase
MEYLDIIIYAGFDAKATRDLTLLFFRERLKKDLCPYCIFCAVVVVVLASNSCCCQSTLLVEHRLRYSRLYRYLVIMLGLTCLLAVIAVASTQGQQYKLDVQLLARNLGSPVDLAFMPGDTSGRSYIVVQDGRVLIMEANNTVDFLNPFLNIHEKVLGLVYPFDERGFIGFAFHPNYSDNGKVYVRYTANRTKTENLCRDENGTIPTTPDGCPDQHSSLLSEFTVSANNPNLIDPNTEKILMQVENPTGRNIGAELSFGPGALCCRK